jgi:hypothetical protein
MLSINKGSWLAKSHGRQARLPLGIFVFIYDSLNLNRTFVKPSHGGMLLKTHSAVLLALNYIIDFIELNSSLLRSFIFDTL